MIAKQASLARASSASVLSASTSSTRCMRLPSTSATAPPAWLARRSPLAPQSLAFSTKGPRSQAIPAAQTHVDHQEPHDSSSAASSAASSSSTASQASSSSHPSASSSRSDRRSRFMPFAFATGSPLTRLPTPLPQDVAERSALLRRQLQPKTKAGTPIPTTSPSLFGDTMAGLSFGDLSGLTMSSADESYYPANKAVEYVSILKACLGTGLISRAHKVFADLRTQAASRSRELWELRQRLAQGIVNQNDRHQDLGELGAYQSPIEVWTYNSMLQAYFRKAYQAESLEGTAEWLTRAWELWRDMENASRAAELDQPPSPDPSPNPATYAIMARGIVALQRSGRYPSTAPALNDLVLSIKRADYGLDSILTSPAFNPQSAEDPDVTGPLGSTSVDQSREGEVDAEVVLRSLTTVANQMGETGMLKELETAQSILEGRRVLSEAQSSELPSNHDPLADVPELLPVKTTSKASRLGNEPDNKEGEMPFNLASLKGNLSIVQEARRTISDPYERQKWLEHSAVEAARKRLEHSAEKLEELGLQTTGALQSKPLQKWMWDWYNKLQTALNKDLDRLDSDLKNDVHATKAMLPNEQQMLPFLRLLPVSKLALITILELMRMSGNGGVSDGMKTTRALLQVGRAIETEYHSEVIRKNPKIFQNAQAAQAALKKRGLVDFAARREIKEWQKQQEEQGVMSSIPKWTQITRARVGSYLVQHLMQVATVNRKATDRDGILWEEDQPAFYSTYQYLGGKKLGVIKLNEVVAKRLDKDSISETLHPRHLPMLVPPKPWTSHDSGGYYSVRQSAMRFKDSAEQGSYLRAASDNGDLDTVLAALDVLGNTSWKINKPIFDVMLEVWNSGKDVADMPPMEMETPEPVKPDNYDHDIKARSVYLQRLKQWNQQRSSNHSQRCDVNYKLEIARAYLGERFYFPHNMDFRGRAYPMPPHLNHIGNDLCRGLLMFADSKPLGKAGLRWLRIHISNVFGYDKASFGEREQFAIDHEADIRDSVERPLDGNRWWLKADDPWQCLAACMELRAALDHPEGPEAYESCLPVHQDGTCNGLQHYAALGGDLAGAKQVNLSGGDRPADVYSGVADLVIKVLDEEAAKGDRTAKILQGKVTRKVVKQTVMTTVYGVTFIGAKNQVMRQLADRGDVPAEDLFNAASFLAKVIMSCIGNLFSGAQKIQDWLSFSAKVIAKSIPGQRVEEATRPYLPNEANLRRADVRGFSRDPAKADRIAKEQMTSVIWTTALGLPVVQPYRKAKKRQVSTSMQTVFINDPLLNAEVSPAKQASAFPPNFIHSLDATHMILTALECHAAGLTFASVHDSYWTHAADIDTMSDMIRETFVRLHSQDILYRLREEFLQRYEGYKVPVVSLQAAQRRRPRSKATAVEDGVSSTSSPSETVLAMPADELAKLEGDEGELILGKPSREAAEEDGDDVDSAEAAATEEGQDAEAAAQAPAKKTRSRKSKAEKDEEWESKFKAKFVNLADILPPIPAKGSFDVNEIKRSLYFFS
ncbi:DNA/RNA polymerase [Moesziomyces antarcticus]|uniref:DNA-directed RNA polymerase n=2 Tax=Pseudozyma antarctica TaxID=84753 RepID=A0A081CEP0_PSEA2|nr:DNA/RNA polymerase [Moesziomyces antarcticus]GAK65136.1 DNA/RNA polymerase [Moesziomyces antarcticus]SPO45874.1 related to RPO41 - DNA-directed RNA polymerase, mitochondrial [Moesziomyces antarcticus]